MSTSVQYSAATDFVRIVLKYIALSEFVDSLMLNWGLRTAHVLH